MQPLFTTPINNCERIVLRLSNQGFEVKHYGVIVYDIERSFVHVTKEYRDKSQIEVDIFLINNDCFKCPDPQLPFQTLNWSIGTGTEHRIIDTAII